MTRNLLSLLKSAIALAETLNLSRAAMMRHISQPTLTNHISTLEDLVGMSLFERDRQNVAILDSGRAFIEEARLSVLHFERAIRLHERSHRTQKRYSISDDHRRPIRLLSRHCCRYVRHSIRPSKSSCSVTFLVT